jgi:transcriptional regulator with XRE-family HTH domain
MMLRVAVGDVVRELRTERGWTLRQLSAKSNVSIGYLSEVERGVKEMSSQVIQSVADGLGVQLAEIVVEAGFRLGGYDYDKLFAEFLENNDLVSQ